MHEHQKNATCEVHFDNFSSSTSSLKDGLRGVATTAQAKVLQPTAYSPTAHFSFKWL